MRDPVETAADGQTYKRAAIERWLERSDTSPVNGAKLPSKTLVPNIALRQAVEEWEHAFAVPAAKQVSKSSKNEESGSDDDNEEEEEEEDGLSDRSQRKAALDTERKATPAKKSKRLMWTSREILTAAEVDAMKVDTLKQHLKDRNMDAYGLKADLASQLKKAVKAEIQDGVLGVVYQGVPTRRTSGASYANPYKTSPGAQAGGSTCCWTTNLTTTIPSARRPNSVGTTVRLARSADAGTIC